ncbi:MAG: hypothetical protein CVV58_06450 [Tenericutes bacterium HGW-Tenericutes-3]|nr:MAG: hypothetical protein CVV58_06450 [Tenericutes bacterium HGW-Tenericutes-3]
MVNYKISMDINKPINEVVSLYTNLGRMTEWEPGLKEIIETKGKLFNTGSEGVLVFHYQNQEMRMKTFVESNQLPKQITIIYEMMGTWNRCVNNFKQVNAITVWEMNVEFRFSKPTETPKEKFIEQTTSGMKLFKAFVEQN